MICNIKTTTMFGASFCCSDVSGKDRDYYKDLRRDGVPSYNAYLQEKVRRVLKAGFIFKEIIGWKISKETCTKNTQSEVRKVTSKTLFTNSYEIMELEESRCEMKLSPLESRHLMVLMLEKCSCSTCSFFENKTKL